MLTNEQAKVAAEALTKPRQDQLANEAEGRNLRIEAAKRRRVIVGAIFLVLLVVAQYVRTHS